ncbi:YfcC family protein [Tissierella praeacuta]|uniref:YfcC family protein n=1 Tax=Tissierella praeacuta TaxID=43131 RepID=UPI000EB9C272|nr:TIGR00366 family protein [Tissierella praeacuta]HAE92614.1 YfcC family protein [Tissierella sp.]
MAEKTVNVKKKREFPHTLIIISCIILLAALLTYIVPAGQYDRVEDPASGRVLVDPSSYHGTEKNPASIMDIFTAVPKGFLATSWICFLILIVGGTFSVVTSTGAIQAFLNKAISKAKGKDIYFIPVLVFIFSLIPTFIGTLEAYLAFVPLGVLLARSMGLDALVGISIVVAGGGAGLASGIFNPFTIGTAQGLVGLPLFSAAWYRVIAFIGFNCSVSFWTVKYAKSIRKDPKNSIIYDVEQAAKKDAEEQVMPELDAKNIGILLAVFAGMAFVVYTALTGGDFKTEVPAIFLMMMLVVGVIARYSPNKLMELFVKGASGMVGGIMVVGFAKAIAIIMEGAGMIDTIVYALSGMLTGTSKVFGAVTMFFIQYITNFFIISGAGQAAVTIPILSPIGDIIGITQQTVCAAFQYGDGITNLLLPMSPLTSGAIAIAGISYPKYFKYIWKIILTNTIIGAICVAIAAAINLGPF